MSAPIENEHVRGGSGAPEQRGSAVAAHFGVKPAIDVNALRARCRAGRENRFPNPTGHASQAVPGVPHVCVASRCPFALPPVPPCHRRDGGRRPDRRHLSRRRAGPHGRVRGRRPQSRARRRRQAGRAVPVGRRRPTSLRLLRPDHVGLRPVGQTPAPHRCPAVRRHPAHRARPPVDPATWSSSRPGPGSSTTWGSTRAQGSSGTHPGPATTCGVPASGPGPGTAACSEVPEGGPHRRLDGGTPAAQTAGVSIPSPSGAAAGPPGGRSSGSRTGRR